MTREEAARVLWWASKQHYPGDQMDITEYVIEAFDIAAAALRGSADKTKEFCMMANQCICCGQEMPESVVDRCTKSHEYIFLMSKRPKYYQFSALDYIFEPVVQEMEGA